MTYEARRCEECGHLAAFVGEDGCCTWRLFAGAADLTGTACGCRELPYLLPLTGAFRDLVGLAS